MPILKNAKKALRVSKRKTVINSRVKSKMKTAVKQMTKSPSAEALRVAYSNIDKAVKNKLIKKNKAARMKSQLSALAKPAKKEVAKEATPKKVTAKKTSKATKTATK